MTTIEYNKLSFEKQPKKIQLTQNKICLVDEEDYNWLSKYKWYAHKEGSNWYVTGREIGNKKIIRMHRLILNPPNDMQIDHIDGDGLNNQKNNLRICTLQQNRMNQRPRPGNSKYKGVYCIKKNNIPFRWHSHLNINNKRINIGYFKTENEAALAYNKKAIEVFREFAKLNIIVPL